MNIKCFDFWCTFVKHFIVTIPSTQQTQIPFWINKLKIDQQVMFTAWDYWQVPPVYQKGKAQKILYVC